MRRALCPPFYLHFHNTQTHTLQSHNTTQTQKHLEKINRCFLFIKNSLRTRSFDKKGTHAITLEKLPPKVISPPIFPFSGTKKIKRGEPPLSRLAERFFRSETKEKSLDSGSALLVIIFVPRRRKGTDWAIAPA